MAPGVLLIKGGSMFDRKTIMESLRRYGGKPSTYNLSQWARNMNDFISLLEYSENADLAKRHFRPILYEWYSNSQIDNSPTTEEIINIWDNALDDYLKL